MHILIDTRNIVLRNYPYLQTGVFSFFFFCFLNFRQIDSFDCFLTKEFGLQQKRLKSSRLIDIRKSNNKLQFAPSFFHLGPPYTAVTKVPPFARPPNTDQPLTGLRTVARTRDLVSGWSGINNTF